MALIFAFGFSLDAPSDEGVAVSAAQHEGSKKHRGDADAEDGEADASRKKLKTE